MILFPGAFGLLRAVSNTFLVRLAPNFAALDFDVAVVDTPSEQPSGMRDGFRMGEAHATDVAAVFASTGSKPPTQRPARNSVYRAKFRVFSLAG